MPVERKAIRCLGTISDTTGGSGIPIKLYLSLTYQGSSVTNRIPVNFMWGRKTAVRLGFGQNVLFDGIALFQGYRRKAPFRIRDFGSIQARPEFTLELVYRLGEFDFSQGQLDIKVEVPKELLRKTRFEREPVI